jgi:hypothetical protein
MLWGLDAATLVPMPNSVSASARRWTICLIAVVIALLVPSASSFGAGAGSHALSSGKKGKALRQCKKLNGPAFRECLSDANKLPG